MYADNNAEAIFKQDSREKKTIGHSAAKRVGKRKRVTFPSDYLSAKELKRMNGDVKNYRLDQPISWREFKAMPDDLRKQYLSRLKERYSATNSAIGKMMGVTESTICMEGKRLGVPSHGKGTRTAPEFWNFVHYGTPIPPIAEAKDIAPDADLETAPNKDDIPARTAKANNFGWKQGLITTKGKAAEIAEALFQLLSDSKEYRVSIEFAECEVEQAHDND